MEIKAIKEQLAIETVLQHYGLKSDRQHRLLCPFHNDKTPSLQIYPKTGTYCCFSSNCTAGTGDVIQFIQLKENCSKHEAITKAASLVNGNTITVMPANNKIQPAENNLDKIAVLSKVFAYFKIGLPCSKKKQWNILTVAPLITSRTRSVTIAGVYTGRVKPSPGRKDGKIWFAQT